jgi:hypothetical protein
MSQPAHNRVLIRTARPLGARPQEFFVSPQRIHWSHRFHPVLPSPSASPRLRLGGVPIKIRVKPSSLQILSPFLSVVPCFQICVHLCLSVVEKIRVNSWNTRQTPFPVLFLCVSASAVHPVRKTPAISFSKICENPSKTPHRQAWSTLIFFRLAHGPQIAKFPASHPRSAQVHPPCSNSPGLDAHASLSWAFLPAFRILSHRQRKESPGNHIDAIAVLPVCCAARLTHILP